MGVASRPGSRAYRESRLACRRAPWALLEASRSAARWVIHQDLRYDLHVLQACPEIRQMISNDGDSVSRPDAQQIQLVCHFPVGVREISSNDDVLSAGSLFGESYGTTLDQH